MIKRMLNLFKRIKCIFMLHDYKLSCMYKGKTLENSPWGVMVDNCINCDAKLYTEFGIYNGTQTSYFNKITHKKAAFLINNYRIDEILNNNYEIN